MTSPFAAALGEGFADLPEVLRWLHAGKGQRHCSGQVTVEPGGRLARLICRIAGFPRGAGEQPFEFGITPQGSGEVWHRRFGNEHTRSALHLSGAGALCESFGPFRLTLQLAPISQGFTLRVSALYLWHLPLPKALLPQTLVTETADETGTIRFDIAARLPLLGPLIRYHGQMRRLDE